jgi:hypothetical protein
MTVQKSALDTSPATDASHNKVYAQTLALKAISNGIKLVSAGHENESG